MQIHSIFESISGEAGGFSQGTWCTFIRLQGCNLNCSWCDTPEARSMDGGTEISIQDILPKVSTKHVLITGGEPLLQRIDTASLIQALLDHGHVVQVETNGTYPIPTAFLSHPNVYWVIDYKTPSSGMHRNPFRGMEGTVSYVMAGKYIKFVIADLDDLVFSLNVMEEILFFSKHPYFILSPVNAD